MLVCAHAEERVRGLPIPGADQLWANPEVRFVVVGEMHGTNEAPAIFKVLVCSARHFKRPIIVGVELHDQGSVNSYLESTAEETARRELLSKAEWQNGSDGRTSLAMLELLQHLRSLRLEGSISSVVAFSVTQHGETAAQGEERMAEALLTAAKQSPKALVIVLTGNVHACKKMIAELGSYPLMASFLPSAHTKSLFVIDKGGEAWACEDGGCGPHGFGATKGFQRQVILKPGLSPLPGYDGVVSTGLRATASPPATQLARKDH